MGMMTIEQVKTMDKTTNPRKLFPTTIAFMKEMRNEVNEGRKRNEQKVIPWTSEDEDRY